MKWFAEVLQLAGLWVLVVAGFVVSVALGLLVLACVLILVGLLLDPRFGRRGSR